MPRETTGTKDKTDAGEIESTTESDLLGAKQKLISTIPVCKKKLLKKYGKFAVRSLPDRLTGSSNFFYLNLGVLKSITLWVC